MGWGNEVDGDGDGRGDAADDEVTAAAMGCCLLG